MIDLKVVAQGDPYDAVLADLRAKREAIDNAITVLENLRAGQLGSASQAPAVNILSTGSDETSKDAGMFLGMSIVDASKKLLGLRKRSMANAEILKELQEGGLVLTGADPLNVVGSVLMRRFNNVGDIVRVRRGVWGLKEWYPGRNFKAPSKAADTEVANEADAGKAAAEDTGEDLA